MLRKNPREQKTNKDIPNSIHTQMPNPNWKDGETYPNFPTQTPNPKLEGWCNPELLHSQIWYILVPLVIRN
jgi:hypothetical protein